MHITNAYRIIPVYTADVSGVCSALYELGGMVVMHDPSGCNSTYNTHDETRWYGKDSMIYISGLTEIDAIMGNDERFVGDVVDAAARLKPRFIAVAGSPVPYLNGTDFKALAKLIEKKSGIVTFSVPTNGMHDYVQGAGDAFCALAERFLHEKKEKEPKSLSILGLTPLDFAAKETACEMKGFLQENGWKVNFTWITECTLENIEETTKSEVNLVVSSVGIKLANKLFSDYGIPYVAVTPVDGIKSAILEALEQARKTGENRFLSKERGDASNSDTLIIGEPITMGSVAMALEKKNGKPVRLICPIEKCGSLLAESDIAVHGECAVEEAIKQAKVIIADPLYKPITPKGCEFVSLPHEAFSGRSYWKEMPDLFAMKI